MSPEEMMWKKGVIIIIIGTCVIFLISFLVQFKLMALSYHTYIYAYVYLYLFLSIIQPYELVPMEREYDLLTTPIRLTQLNRQPDRYTVFLLHLSSFLSFFLLCMYPCITTTLRFDMNMNMRNIYNCYHYY